jgi:hypothetical protein
MNTEKFLVASFKDRIEEVKVAELKHFFDDGEDPIWVVRGLTAEEIAKSNQAVKNNRDLGKLIDAITSETDKAETVKQIIGVQSDKVPNDVVNRISMLVSGSINPVCTEEMAVKLGNNFSTVFYHLTNRILHLTGKGRLLGE